MQQAVKSFSSGLKIWDVLPGTTFSKAGRNKNNNLGDIFSFF